MINMKRAATFILLLPIMGSRAQYDMQAKELFDKLGHKVVYHGSYDGIVNYMLYTNPWSDYEYGEQVGPALEGYMRLYETTKDKSYLIKFVNLALKAIAWRKADYRFNDLLYMDGHLIWPLAHFIHLVLIDDPDLALFEVANNAGLVQVPSSTIPENELPFQFNYTFQEIATWLLLRCVESLDAIVDDEWDQDVGFVGAAAVNMQGGFAGALLHLGHMAVADATYSGLQSYWDRGARLAALFRSHVDIEDDCSCSSYSYPVLRSGSHNSYWWYHSGWHYRLIESCGSSCFPFAHFDQPNLNEFQQYIEDISHAIPALIIPFMSYRYSVHTGGQYPFTDTEMVRFRNTFTKHVWDANAGGFHNAVNGQDGPVYPPAYNGQFDLLSANALAWMPLQRFDQVPGAAAGDRVYDVIMEHYSSEVQGQPTSLTAGFHYLGLAEVVAAQWENECFDLTLYNRDLVYDQDFAAKDVLTVDAFGEAGASFADPVITDPRFTVNAGVHAGFRAGHAVVWEPGFEAEPGSVVEATIDPLGCELMYRNALVGAGPGPLIDRNEVPDPSAPDPVAAGKAPLDDTARAEALLTWMPDTGGAEAGLRLVLPTEAHVIVELWDGLGRRIHVVNVGQRTEGAHEIPLPVTDIASGLYIAVVWLNGTPHTMRSFVP